MNLFINIGIKGKMNMKMMNLVYNEATVLNNFLEKGECKIREDKIIMILIKYYYINGVIDKLQLREKILEDLYKISDKNTRNIWTKKVDKTICSFMKSLKNDNFVLDIVEVDSVDIYEEELEIIESASEVRYKKLLFILLVWAKVYKKFNRTIIIENLSDLFSLAKCKIGNKTYRNLVMYEIKEQGFGYTKRENGNYQTKINYLKEEGEIAFTVDDIENAIYYYLNWKGERWIKCSKCSEYFKRTTKKIPKYCRNCAKEINIENTKNKYKIRKNG